MQITITVGAVKDTKILTGLSIRTFRETFEADNNPEDMDQYIAEELSEEKIRTTIVAENNIFFMAYADGILAGYAKMRTVEFPDELKDNKPIEMERIYTLKEYQGKKVGAALMKHCLDHAKANGYDCAWLGVWEHNTIAVNFYKRWGFEFFGSHIFRLGSDDQIDLLMKKKI